MIDENRQFHSEAEAIGGAGSGAPTTRDCRARAPEIM